MGEGCGEGERLSQCEKNAGSPGCLVGPALLIIVLTTIYPLLAALYYSFHKYNLRRPPQFAIQIGENGIHIDWSLLSLNNYALAFSDSRFINSLNVTFWFTVISVALSVVIGLFIAVVVQKGGRLHTLDQSAAYLPLRRQPRPQGLQLAFHAQRELWHLRPAD